MANFKSVQLGGVTASARTFPMSSVGMGGRTTHGARALYNLTAALALNDTIELFDIPARARIVGGFVLVDDLDTNGTPTIALAVGDAGDDDRYFSGVTVAQTGGLSSALALTGIDYVTAAKTRVIAKVTTGPATGATSGKIVVVLHYWVEEPA